MQKLYRQMAERRINSVPSTSAGRLFDAVSAILGVRKQSSFEGEASTTLQFRAEAFEKRLLAAGQEPEQEAARQLKGWLTEGAFVPDIIQTEKGGTDPAEAGKSGTLSETGDSGAEAKLILPTDRLVRLLVERRLAGEDPGGLAYLFHYALADLIRAGCREASRLTGETACALSGGVFQNQLLLRLCDRMLQEDGFTVYRHSLIPPNDGGLALGQAVYGMVYLQEESER